jgi:hypothetical protein
VHASHAPLAFHELPTRSENHLLGALHHLKIYPWDVHHLEIFPLGVDVYVLQHASFLHHFFFPMYVLLDNHQRAN